MTTLDVVPKKKSESSAEETAAKELVRRLAREQGLSLTGPDGLLKQFTKSVLETALNEEMTEHLAREKHRALEDRDSANVRNGTRPKTVLTEATGQVQIECRATGMGRSSRSTCWSSGLREESGLALGTWSAAGSLPDFVLVVGQPQDGRYSVLV
jgi:hypothetical protein